VKSVITYFKTSGITCLRKHVDVDHSKILRTFKEEVNSTMKKSLEKQPTKKRLNIFGPSSFNCLTSKKPFKKMMWSKIDFGKSSLLIVKNNLPLQFVGNVWLKCLILHLCQ
jgi:hypothetical protein